MVFCYKEEFSLLFLSGTYSFICLHQDGHSCLFKWVIVVCCHYLFDVQIVLGLADWNLLPAESCELTQSPHLLALILLGMRAHAFLAERVLCCSSSGGSSHFLRSPGYFRGRVLETRMKACSCCRWGSAGVTHGSGALSPSQVHVTRVLMLTLPIRGQLHGARPHIPLAMCVTSPVAQEPGSGLRVEVPCVLEAGEDLQLGRGSCVSQGSGRGGWGLHTWGAVWRDGEPPARAVLQAPFWVLMPRMGKGPLS